MNRTRVSNATKGHLIQSDGNNIVIGQIHWKGCAYPVREINTEKQIFRVSVESLRDELINDMRNGDRKSTRLNSSHITRSRMPSSA